MDKTIDRIQFILYHNSNSNSFPCHRQKRCTYNDDTSIVNSDAYSKILTKWTVQPNQTVENTSSKTYLHWKKWMKNNLLIGMLVFTLGKFPSSVRFPSSIFIPFLTMENVQSYLQSLFDPLACDLLSPKIVTAHSTFVCSFFVSGK